MNFKYIGLLTLFVLGFLSNQPAPVLAVSELIGEEGLWLKKPEPDYKLTSEGVFRTDLVWLDNGIDLDNKNNNDSFEYIGIDYRVNLDFEYKDLLELFISLERNGPSDFDAPILGRRTVRTSFGDVQTYKNRGFLPEVEQWFADFRVPSTQTLHFKFGLFPMNVGNGVAVGSYNENYGLSLYQETEAWGWHFHYFKPDWNNDFILGPNLQQEERLGRGNQKTVADLFVLDSVHYWNQPASKKYVPGGSIQPYLSLLSDRSGAGKRSNAFATQTEQDLLGTLGADLNLVFGRLELGFETARNFGEAQVLDGAEDINHKGYMIHADAALDLKEIRSKPRTRFLLLSGNDLRDSEDGLIHGSTNRAFSVYTPTNLNLSDTVYPPQVFSPYAAGNSNGLNFGILRPGSFNDPYPIDNIIAPNVGVDIKPWERLNLALDWWYLAAQQPGIGTWEGNSKKLSKDLGHELSMNAEFQITKHMSLGCLLAYFLPGKYYREYRDDAGNSLSPLIRTGGDADNVFIGELRLTVSY